MTRRFPASVTRLVRSGLLPLAAVSSCARNPAGPSSPALQITCPPARTAESLTGNLVAVEFGAATTTGGQAPVSVTCNPASGSTFPVALTATRFLAFGDSITFASASTPCSVALTAGMTFREFMPRDARDVHPHADLPPPPSAYPNVLQQL